MRHKTPGEWAVIALGILVLIFGIPILALGVWLIWLGGSWYYAPAGAALVVTAWFLFKREMVAFWIYLATFICTVVWAFWERGYDGWAQVPRLVAPTVIMVLILLALPVLHRHGRRPARQIIAGAVSIAAAGCLAALGLHAFASRAHAEIGLAGFAQSQANLTSQANPTPKVALLPINPTDAHPADAPSAQSAPPLPGVLIQPEKLESVGQDWPAWGGTYEGTRYSPLKTINLSNVAQLKKIWAFETGDLPGVADKDKYSPETTPIKIGDRLYLCSAKDIMIAADAATGKEIWRFDPKVLDDAIPYGATCHAVAYYALPAPPGRAMCDPDHRRNPRRSADRCRCQDGSVVFELRPRRDGQPQTGNW